MAILKIARMGHPVLRRVADPVADPTDPEIQRLILDMAETMEDAAGWFDNTPLTDEQRLQIGRTNAIKLFKLDLT